MSQCSHGVEMVMIHILKNGDSSGSLRLAFLTAPLTVAVVTNASGRGRGQGGLYHGRVWGRHRAGEGLGEPPALPSSSHLPARAGLIALEAADC